MSFSLRELQEEKSRIKLRFVTDKDANDLFEIYGCKKTMEFASDTNLSHFIQIFDVINSMRRLYISGESIEFCIVNTINNKVIGVCGLHSFSTDRGSCEVGAILNRRYWGLGYMREALLLLIKYAKENGISKLIADIDERNLRSQNLFERLGFTFENGRHEKHLIL